MVIIILPRSHFFVWAFDLSLGFHFCLNVDKYLLTFNRHSFFVFCLLSGIQFCLLFGAFTPFCRPGKLKNVPLPRFCPELKNVCYICYSLIVILFIFLNLAFYYINSIILFNFQWKRRIEGSYWNWFPWWCCRRRKRNISSRFGAFSVISSFPWSWSTISSWFSINCGKVWVIRRMFTINQAGT